MNMTKEKLCQIRTDLRNDNILVLVGDFLISNGTYPYRWVNDEDFEVFVDGQWRSADSIDFEFI